MRFACLFILACIFITPYVQSQTRSVQGSVTDQDGTAISYVNIAVKNTTVGASTDEQGVFNLQLPRLKVITLLFSHVNYESQSILLDTDTLDDTRLAIFMYPLDSVLEHVLIEGEEDIEIRRQAGLVKLDPIPAKTLPTTFGDFSQYLATLPGVVSNNELSSGYAVRGGNFDENLVYVNDIQIYRPFLIHAGEQDGLSFVNTDLVSNVTFSSGGWAPKYGDKLSSNLAISYKRPQEFGGSLTLSLLMNAFHLEGASKNKRTTYLIGYRNKRSEYLLNTLETKGEYLPRYTDIQSWFNFDLASQTQKDKDITSEIGVLFSYARNRYLVRPESRETSFGTFNQVLNLFVAFDGQETMEYDTYQGGLKYSYFNGKKFKTDVVFSQLFTREREYFDIEGGYRLCDVDKRSNSETFNQCIALRGIGTDYEHARNRLNAVVLNSEIRSTYDLAAQHYLDFGLGYSYQMFNDSQHEYSFIDSADYTTITDLVSSENELKSGQLVNIAERSGRDQDKDGGGTLAVGLMAISVGFIATLGVLMDFGLATEGCFGCCWPIAAKIGFILFPISDNRCSYTWSDTWPLARCLFQNEAFLP